MEANASLTRTLFLRACRTILGTVQNIEFGGRVIFNYRCSPMATAASGLACPFSSTENRDFFSKSAFRLVKAPALGRLRSQGKSNGYEANFRSMTLTSPVHVSANGLRQLPSGWDHRLPAGSPRINAFNMLISDHGEP